MKLDIDLIFMIFLVISMALVGLVVLTTVLLRV